jgi:hypothetical protein
VEKINNERRFQIMLHITQNDHLLTIDAREDIRAGKHPRMEIMKIIHESGSGTLFEIHTPHQTPRLITAIEGLGVPVSVTKLADHHFRLRGLRL